IVTERVITTPAPVVTERTVSAPLAVETVGVAADATEEMVPASVELLVGSRVPATVPLYALPAPVGLRLPAARPYRYELVDDRVVLIDPLPAVVAADLAP